MPNEYHNKIAVVLVHWKFLNNTLECVESLQQSSRADFDIIISNNDETPFPLEKIANTANISVINNNANLDFIKACNIGFKLALERGYPFIFMLNNDTTVAPDTLMKLREFSDLHPNLIISPISYLYGTKDSVENAGGSIFWVLGLSRLNKSVSEKSPDYLSGACIFARHEHFQEIGLLDEAYDFYWDDSDWSARAKKKGFSLTIFPEAVIWHKHSASEGKRQAGWSPKKMYHISRNTLYFAKKNLSGLRKLCFIGGYIFCGGFLHILFFCRNLNTLKAYFKGIKDGLKNVS